MISPWDPAPAARTLPAPARDAPAAAPSRGLLLLDYHVPLAEAMRDTVPELEAHPRGQRPPSGPSRPSRDSRRSPAPCSTNRSTPPSVRSCSPRRSAPDRPAARLPLGAGGADPARLRRDHRPRRPRRPRLPHLADADRRALARRLHDDGAGARRRLLAADRLPLSRGARRRSLAGRGGAVDPGAAPGGRRRSPARPSSSRSSSRPSSSPGPCSSRSPPRSPSSPRSRCWSPGSALPALLTLLGPRINAGRIGSSRRGHAAPASPPPPPRPCAAPHWRRR